MSERSIARVGSSEPIDLGRGIRLLSGAMFDYAAPERCEVTIGDLAGALSKICRFAGHINQFYSVAQHAVNVSRIVPPEHAFDALMHDTAEAFTNDLPTPLKHAFPAFKTLEERIESAMAARFGFAWPMPEAVRLADLQMLWLEKQVLKDDDSHWSIFDGMEPPSFAQSRFVNLFPMESGHAEARFLDRFHELQPREA